jgi:hypothetical protein
VDIFNSRAPHVPEIIPTDQSVDSLIDITTGVAVVPSDYKEQEVSTLFSSALVCACFSNTVSSIGQNRDSSEATGSRSGAGRTRSSKSDQSRASRKEGRKEGRKRREEKGGRKQRKGEVLQVLYQKPNYPSQWPRFCNRYYCCWFWCV